MIINVTLKLPDGKEITLPVEEARQLYYSLHNMFGNRPESLSKWSELPAKYKL